MKIDIQKLSLKRSNLLILGFLMVSLVLILNNRKAGPQSDFGSPTLNGPPLSQASVAPSAPPSTVESKQITLKRGSNLNNLLLKQGLNKEQAAEIVYEASRFIDLTQMQAGQNMTLLSKDGIIQGLIYPLSSQWNIEILKNNFQHFEAKREFVELISYPTKVSATVESSLYSSCVKAGLPDGIIMNLIQLFSFDIDYQRDIQRGDKIQVLYEKKYNEENKVVGNGNILYARFTTSFKDIEVYRFTDEQGRADYYNAKGETIRKTLLKTPVNGAYISSPYGMRVSPISGFTKMHRGIDFAVPMYTPIKASGDGVVVSAYYNRVYGNHVTLRHTNSYKTMYAHMSRFAKNLKKGTRVRQGQVIGYVGTTGMSTGPHVHYEVFYYGKQVNPSSVKFPPGKTLKGTDLKLFQNLRSSYKASFE